MTQNELELQGYVKANTTASVRFINPKKLADDNITGVILKGIYDGTQPNAMSGKNDFVFLEETGNKAVINNSGNLAREMETVEVGMEVAVIYNGKKKIKGGSYKGKDSHSFSVYKKGDGDAAAESQG